MKRRKVRLYGNLARKFGRVHYFYASDMADIISALSVRFHSFKKTLIQGHYLISKKTYKGRWCMSEEDLPISLGEADEVGIFPVVQGAGFTEWFKRNFVNLLAIVAGIIVIIATGGASLALGISLISAGVSGIIVDALLLALQPNQEQPERINRSNINSDNNVRQGNPVPIVYGKIRIGSTVISSGTGVVQ